VRRCYQSWRVDLLEGQLLEEAPVQCWEVAQRTWIADVDSDKVMDSGENQWPWESQMHFELKEQCGVEEMSEW
jgi:hypothetical protein